MAKIKQFEAFTKMCVAYKKTGCSYYSTDKKKFGSIGHLVLELFSNSIEEWPMGKYWRIWATPSDSPGICFSK